eukprot:scaffold86013_cov61-Cyclotella_meneghiniana.AAC.3
MGSLVVGKAARPCPAPPCMLTAQPIPPTSQCPPTPPHTRTTRQDESMHIKHQNQSNNQQQTTTPNQGMPVVKKSATCMTVDCQLYACQLQSSGYSRLATVTRLAPVLTCFCVTRGTYRG